ncbi:ankyrin repeat protein [Purpureocillium lavendulum]|uniref:Ankyrin repeat protein n=1 Tax=Purpureocillium lavendulum TaxID=1247861 RepID=A0AB34G654_9HYPO|nr:ankyrin repeat protein [Purpureocillium lavendulum]
MVFEFLIALVASVIMAHFVPSLLIRRLQRMELPEPDEPERRADDLPATPADKTPANNDRYHPSPIDIAVTRIMLVRSKRLPPDIVDAVFDFAEYWAHSTNAINFTTEHQDHLRISGSSEVENKFLLRSFPLGLTGITADKSLAEELAYDTNESKPQPLAKDRESSYFAMLANYPTPRLARPCRKVVFSIRGKDQGWVTSPDSRDTYSGSWTWYEAGLERFDATQDCDSKCTSDSSDQQTYTYDHTLFPQDPFLIQKNRAASKDFVDHVVTWSYLDDAKPDSDAGKALEDKGRGRHTGDGEFVRDLRLGDVVTVWGMARFAAWVNNVEAVKIDLYWAV